MKILGFDPSLTAFGWALHDTSATGPARCLQRGRIKSKEDDVTDFVDRYAGIRNRLVELIRELEPDCMGAESPVFGDMYSEGMYALFVFTNEAIKIAGKNVVYFTPMQVKAHARESLGRPKGWVMKKPDMVAAAKADTETVKPWDHNEADAYLVARLAGRFWELRESLASPARLPVILTDNERHLFTHKHTFTRGKKAGTTEETGLLYRERERFYMWGW